jgi:hypothetical protein
MERRKRIQLVLFALSAVAYFPFSEWISTTRVGTTVFLWGQAIYLFPLLGAILAAPFLLISLLSRRTRQQSFFYLLISILLIATCVFGIKLGNMIRSARMESFAERSRTLIDAIEKYDRDHSNPPKSLNDLVPDYIPAVPSTGMMAYPEYQYHTGDEAREYYSGNPWALSVFTPSGFINFDIMLYLPNKNYPRHGYGGTLQPIGDWAYVHE